MNDKEIYNNLIVFFEMINKTIINEKSLLFIDLELNGTDADNFLEMFQKKFNVDMSNFNYSDYFLDETFFLFQFMILKLFKKEKKLKTFSIYHLIEVVKKGKWFSPE